MSDIQGAQVDPNELEAVKLAIAAVVKNFTYAGINVGGYITDDELTQVATAALLASNNYKKSPSI